MVFSLSPKPSANTLFATADSDQGAKNRDTRGQVEALPFGYDEKNGNMLTSSRKRVGCGIGNGADGIEALTTAADETARSNGPSTVSDVVEGSSSASAGAGGVSSSQGRDFVEEV